jgi:hypothetical protein
MKKIIALALASVLFVTSSICVFAADEVSSVQSPTPKEIMEKLYPGYLHVRTTMRYSEAVDGAYIRCVMRKQPGRGPGR